MSGQKMGLTRRSAVMMPIALGGAAMLPRTSFGADSLLRVCLYTNPTSLDPHTGRSGADHATLWAIFDTLIDIDFEKGTPVPKLAKSWEFRDPTTLVLNLVEGVSFHDGVAFDAEAVKANFDHILKNPRTTAKGEVPTVVEVNAEAKYRVVIKLRQPDASILLSLTDRPGMMSSPKAIAEHGDNYDRNPVGTGMWKFVSWTDNSRIELVRNENYWRKGYPKVDRIQMQIFTDSNVGLRAVQGGQADFAYRLPAQQVPVIRRNPNVVLNISQGLYFRHVYLNRSRKPLDNKLLRQAMTYGIDRDAYNKVISDGLGEPAWLPVPSTHWAFDKEAAAMYRYDPDKARALIKQGGLEGVEIHALHYTDQLSMQSTEIIVGQLEQIGLKFKLTGGTIAPIGAMFRKGTGDMLISGWTGRADPSTYYAQMFLKNGTFNRGGATPPKEVEDAIAESVRSSDIDERKRALAKLAKAERENAMVLMLAYEPEIVVHSKRVKGYRPTIIGKPRFDDVSVDA